MLVLLNLWETQENFTLRKKGSVLLFRYILTYFLKSLKSHYPLRLDGLSSMTSSSSLIGREKPRVSKQRVYCRKKTLNQPKTTTKKTNQNPSEGS